MDNPLATHAMKKANGIEVGETVYVESDNHEYTVAAIVRLHKNTSDGTEAATYFLLRDYGVSLQCVHEDNVMRVNRR